PSGAALVLVLGVNIERDRAVAPIPLKVFFRGELLSIGNFAHRVRLHSRAIENDSGSAFALAWAKELPNGFSEPLYRTWLAEFRVQYLPNFIFGFFSAGGELGNQVV